MTVFVCCWQPFMHVSRWVLVESLLLPLIPGRYSPDRRDSCFFISTWHWNEYCNFSWCILVAKFKVFWLKKCLRTLFCYIDWNVFCMWVHCTWELYGLQWISLLDYHDEWPNVLNIHNSWEKWHCFMLCLDLWLRQKGQIILSVFTWIEQVSSILDHYLWWKIWIPWSPVLIV